MARINENFQKLTAGYLFPEIARRVNAYTEAEPEKSNVSSAAESAMSPSRFEQPRRR